TATTPRLFCDAKCPPDTPPMAPAILTPAIRSALSTASSIARVVASRSTTTPFRTPADGEVPIPVMWTSPSALCSATTTQTLVVPISSPTKGSRFANQVHLRVRLRVRWTVHRGIYSTRRRVLLPRARWGRRRSRGSRRTDDDIPREPQIHRLDAQAARRDRVERLRDQLQTGDDPPRTAQAHHRGLAKREHHLALPVDPHRDDPTAQRCRQCSGDLRPHPDVRRVHDPARCRIRGIEAIDLERGELPRTRGLDDRHRVAAQQHVAVSDRE